MCLEDIILNLISLEKEGNYWDFKAKHHAKPADLVKDIICLANNTRHSGDRYLIFGVSDDYEIGGCQDADNRPTQAQIIDTLRKGRFASGSFPDIQLQSIQLSDKELDILIIADSSLKPYFLEEDAKIGGRTVVHAGTIYSRIQDSNQVAPAAEVEQLWRIRFGLDSPPTERLKSYLTDFENWSEPKERQWHHNSFPEFTMSKDPEYESSWLVECGESWVRVTPDPTAYVTPMIVKYHQTVIETITCIDIDDFRNTLPAPEKVFPERGAGEDCFYCYCSDTIRFQFLQFFLKKTKEELLNRGLRGGRRIGTLPIIIFNSQTEKEAFIHYLENKHGTIDYSPYNSRINDQRISTHDREIIGYCEAVIHIFNEWREGR